ncbi:MAG: LysR family transcriptional regulator, partial [Planctomycetaceae bacterium]|nr:LysR family transcriptional regulator [Planctomycetaceae bacterium]
LMHIQVAPQTLSKIHMRPITESQVPLSIAMVVRKHGHLPQAVVDFQEIIRRSLTKVDNGSVE